MDIENQAVDGLRIRAVKMFVRFIALVGRVWRGDYVLDNDDCLWHSPFRERVALVSHRVWILSWPVGVGAAVIGGLVGTTFYIGILAVVIGNLIGTAGSVVWMASWSIYPSKRNRVPGRQVSVEKRSRYFGGMPV